MTEIKDTAPKSLSPAAPPSKNSFSIARANTATLKKIGERLGISLIKHRDFWLLGLTFCFFIAALFIFWAYAWQINQIAPAPSTQNQTKIDSTLYQKIIDHSAQKEKQFQEGLNMEYPDIFK